MHLISCARCGKVHEWGKCTIKQEAKRYTIKNRTDEQKFRSTARWQRKAAEIRSRDAELCKLCLYEGRITSRRLSVHHITPIKEDPERKLDDDNLITLCEEHHEEVEGKPEYVSLLYKLAATPPARLLDQIIKRNKTGQDMV